MTELVLAWIGGAVVGLFALWVLWMLIGGLYIALIIWLAKNR